MTVSDDKSVVAYLPNVDVAASTRDVPDHVSKVSRGRRGRPGVPVIGTGSGTVTGIRTGTMMSGVHSAGTMSVVAGTELVFTVVFSGTELVFAVVLSGTELIVAMTFAGTVLVEVVFTAAVTLFHSVTPIVVLVGESYACAHSQEEGED